MSGRPDRGSHREQPRGSRVPEDSNRASQRRPLGAALPTLPLARARTDARVQPLRSRPPPPLSAGGCSSRATRIGLRWNRHDPLASAVVRQDDLIAAWPTLLHVTFASSWESILEHGLWSARELLARLTTTDDARHRLARTRRPHNTVINDSRLGRVTLRDHRAIQPAALDKALGEISAEAWFDELSRRVFFFAREADALKLIGAYSESQVVITVHTARLLQPSTAWSLRLLSTPAARAGKPRRADSARSRSLTALPTSGRESLAKQESRR